MMIITLEDVKCVVRRGILFNPLSMILSLVICYASYHVIKSLD